MSGNPRGVTFVELLVSLAVLALVLSVAGATLSLAPPASAAGTRLGALRREAVAERRVVTDTARDDDTLRLVTALPDGRVYQAAVSAPWFAAEAERAR